MNNNGDHFRCSNTLLLALLFPVVDSCSGTRTNKLDDRWHSSRFPVITSADPIPVDVTGVTWAKIGALSVAAGGVVSTRTALALIDVIRARDTLPTRFTDARAGHVVTWRCVIHVARAWQAVCAEGALRTRCRDNKKKVSFKYYCNFGGYVAGLYAMHAVTSNTSVCVRACVCECVCVCARARTCVYVCFWRIHAVAHERAKPETVIVPVHIPCDYLCIPHPCFGCNRCDMNKDGCPQCCCRCRGLRTDCSGTHWHHQSTWHPANQVYRRTSRKRGHMTLCC